MDKYIGHRVEIIYLSRHEQISQRTVRIISVRNGIVIAFDESKGKPRSFTVDRILASKQVNIHVS